MKTIIWKVSSKDINQASLRYRCLMPVQWMKGLDFEARHIVADNSDILFVSKKIAAIIFCKSFSKNDLQLSRKAQKAGIPIYIDLCDNFFYRHKVGFYKDEREKILLAEAYDVFQEISSYAKYVVTTGGELAEKIVDEFPELEQKIRIIPDSIEGEDDVIFFKYFAKHMKEFKENNYLRILLKAPEYILKKDLYRFLYSQARVSIFNQKSKTIQNNTYQPILEIINNDPREKVLWFGNAGIPDLFGLTDILLIKDYLLEVYKEKPFLLVICSSSREIFEKYIVPIGIDCCYVVWSLESNNQLLKTCNVVIIPNPNNDFTIGKSANRALLALSFKKPVIATFTPALAPLKNLVQFDNWTQNLREDIQFPAYFQKKWETEWQKVKTEYSSRNTAKDWLNILYY